MFEAAFRSAWYSVTQQSGFVYRNAAWVVVIGRSRDRSALDSEVVTVHRIDAPPG